MAFISQTPKRAHGWRDTLPVHPACELITELTPVERYELGADIKADGLRVPIVVYIDPQEKAWLLDGRSRLDGMERVGIGFKLGPSKFRASKDTPRVWAMSFPSGSSYPMTLPSSSIGQFVLTMRDIDPYAYVLSVNIRRRHLTAEQKRDLIDKLLKRDPGKSDRQIAKVVGAHPTTVGTVRKEAEKRGDVSKLDTRTDAKGRAQPAHKAPLSPTIFYQKLEPEPPAVKRRDDWREALRAHLAERTGEELVAGDLFDQFGANMPLHDATRPWVSRGKELGTTPHSVMRWAAFSQALRRLNVSFDPPLTKVTRLTIESADKTRHAKVEEPAASEAPTSLRSKPEDPAKARIQSAASEVSWGLSATAGALATYSTGPILAALTDDERRQARKDIEAVDQLKAALDAPANVVPFPDKPD
jgi:hypothetical protein